MAARPRRIASSHTFKLVSTLPNPMKQSLLLFLALVTLVAGAAPLTRAQAGPTLFRPDLPAPTPPALHASGAPGLAQSSLRCTAVFADPQVSLPPASSPWQVYRSGWTFSSETPFSPPQALYFAASSDGVPASASVGQSISLPANLAELYGSLRYRYASGTTGANDRLLVELYEVGRLDPAALIARVERDTAPDGDGAWRSFEWEVTDPGAIARLRALGRADLLITALNALNGATPRLWLDDLNASVCEPAASLSGQVRQGDAPAADAPLLLTRSDAGGTRLIATASSGADGAYRFAALPALPPESSYRVWFRASLAAPALERGRLGFWAGPQLSQLTEGVAVRELNFDVANVQLASPAPFATVIATSAQPARFSWSGRANAGERHQFCLYDPEWADPATGLPAQLCGPLLDPSREPLAFTLAPGSFADAPGFPFAYGRSYRWYVVVYDRDPRTDPGAQYGYSLFERMVTFLPDPPAAPDAPPAPESGDPAPGAPGADWSLLIYVAADNALGDPRCAPRSARPAGQLARLPALAAQYPNLRVLSLVDDYGPGGLRLCAYPAGGIPDCRLRPEASSADPTTLAEFIAFGRARYPAARTALLIVAPGQAAGQLALDETDAAGDGGSVLSLATLQAAYAGAGLGETQQLDLVIYQAPLLGSLDVLEATAPYARFAVAAAGSLWQLGPYDRLLPLLGGAGSATPATVAAGVVSAYDGTVASVGPGLARSLAAYDLARLGGLAQRRDELADAIRNAIAADSERTRPLVAAARAAAQVYDASGNGRHDQLAAVSGPPIAAEEDALVDLGDLALRLRDTPGIDPALQAAAAALVGLLDDQAASPLLASVQRSGQSGAGAPLSLERARGLAVFFPGGDRLGGQPALTAAYLYGEAGNAPRSDAWAAMLRAYLRETLGTGPGGIGEGPAGAPRFQPLPGEMLATDLWLPMLRR